MVGRGRNATVEDNVDEAAVDVLGSLRASVSGEPVDVRGGKRRALLARLAVSVGEIVPLERLAEDLWPARPQSGIGSIRTYMSQFRSWFGAGRIAYLAPGYILDLPRHAVDATRFEDFVSLARATDDARSRLVKLEEALGLWRGPALLEFADEVWAGTEASRLEGMRRDALHESFATRLDLGDHLALASELEVAVNASPFEERFWAQLMVALYRCGRSADALRAYLRARRILLDELGLEPGPELRRIERAVLDHDPSVLGEPATRISITAPVAPPIASDLSWLPAARLPFVGREAELRRVMGACAPPDDDARLVVVTGDSGAGKTRLAGEAVNLLDEDSTLVLHGRCDEQASGPYQALVPMLTRLASGPVAGVDAALLASVFPGVQPSDRRGSVDATHDAEGLRWRLFAAVASALRANAGARRVVLVLDDVQWADPPTLLLLRHLLLDSGDAPLTSVVVRRQEAGPADEIMSSTFALLDRLGRADTVEIGGLDATSVSLLVEAAGGGSDGDFAARLWAETSGNALFVTEILRHVGEERAWERTDRLLLPASVREAIRQRVRTLPAGAHSAIEAAAVLGVRFDASTVAATARLEMPELVAAIDTALDRRLLSEVQGRPGIFDFVHGIVRDTVYDQIAPTARADLHRRAALALEERLAGSDGEAMAELQWHWETAGSLGDARRAVECRLMAGEDAPRRIAYEAAVTQLDAALDLLDRASVPDATALRSAVLLALADAENRAGDIGAGQRACAEAARLARDAGRTDLFARAALTFGGVLPTGAALEDPQARELLHDALALLEPGDPRFAPMASRLAQFEYWTMPRVDRRNLCELATAAARSHDDRRMLAEVLVCCLWALDCPEELDQRVALASEIEDLARRLGDVELSVQGRKGRLHVLLELGDFGAACALADRLARTAAELHLPEHSRLAVAFDAMRAGVHGRFEEAEKLAAESRDSLIRRGRGGHALVAYVLQVLPWRWLHGDLTPLVQAGAAADTPGSMAAAFAVLQALAAATADDLDEAARLLGAVDLSASIDGEQTILSPFVLAGATQCAALLGAREELTMLAGALTRYEDRNLTSGQVAFFGAASHYLGIATAVVGDRRDAIEHLVNALARHRRMGATPFAALTAAELARVLASGGDARAREIAEGLLHSADGTCRDLDLAWVSRRVAAARAAFD